MSQTSGHSSSSQCPSAGVCSHCWWESSGAPLLHPEVVLGVLGGSSWYTLHPVSPRVKNSRWEKSLQGCCGESTTLVITLGSPRQRMRGHLACFLEQPLRGGDVFCGTWPSSSPVCVEDGSQPLSWAGRCSVSAASGTCFQCSVTTLDLQWQGLSPSLRANPYFSHDTIISRNWSRNPSPLPIADLQLCLGAVKVLLWPRSLYRGIRAAAVVYTKGQARSQTAPWHSIRCVMPAVKTEA